MGRNSTLGEVAELVKQIRETRGLTQEALARELGVTFSTVNGWENGKHTPIPLLFRALRALASESGVRSRVRRGSSASARGARRSLSKGGGTGG
jgi:transcriptional regulator with XRE-family HTH domain